MSKARFVIVVPCYNEAARLERSRFEEFSDAHGDALELLFVDDGSRDGTGELLRDMAGQRPGRIRAMTHPENRGKAEAVRAGMVAALDGGAEAVAYLDADLATPLEELARLYGIFESRNLVILLGARLALHGYDIRRKTSRHYFGRAFATLASGVLRWRVYDTQCGAKIFRTTPLLRAALNEPFISRWGFDIELLGRLLIGGPGVAGVDLARVAEVPLESWYDVPGSKIGLWAMFKTVAELGRIEWDLRKRRRKANV